MDRNGQPARDFPLTSDFSQDGNYPYFLWDDPMTVGEVRQWLKTASEPERLRMLGKILREAKDTDVWYFTTPQQVWAEFDRLRPHLGRRRSFWEYLLGVWHRAGLVGA